MAGGGLGNYAHDAMTDEDPGPALKRLYARADEWFGIKSDEMSSIVRRINESTKEMSRLLQLDTGSGGDVEGIIAQADKQLLEVSKQTLAAGEGEKGMSSLLIDAVQRLIAEIFVDDSAAEARVRTMLVFGMINWTHTWFSEKGPVSADRLAAMAVDLTLAAAERCQGPS